MIPVAALTYAVQLLGAIPSLIEAGASVVDLIQHGQERLKTMQDESRAPTEAEWDELNERIAAKRRELHS